MTDKEQRAALARLALDILELYEDSESARIRTATLSHDERDCADTRLCQQCYGYRKQIKLLSHTDAEAVTG